MSTVSGGSSGAKSTTNSIAYVTLLHFLNQVLECCPSEATNAIGVRAGRNVAKTLIRQHKPGNPAKKKTLKLEARRDALKALCRETWSFIFGKQADRLQVNRETGGFVVWDNHFRGLLHMSIQQNQEDQKNSTSQSHDDSDLYLPFFCAMVRGAVLEFSSHFVDQKKDGCADVVVSATSQGLPECIFHLDFVAN